METASSISKARHCGRVCYCFDAFLGCGRERRELGLRLKLPSRHTTSFASQLAAKLNNACEYAQYAYHSLYLEEHKKTSDADVLNDISQPMFIQPRKWVSFWLQDQQVTLKMKRIHNQVGINTCKQTVETEDWTQRLYL